MVLLWELVAVRNASDSPRIVSHTDSLLRKEAASESLDSFTVSQRNRFTVVSRQNLTQSCTVHRPSDGRNSNAVAWLHILVGYLTQAG